MMDQMLVAAAASGALAFFVAGFYIGRAERKVRNEYEPTETGVQPDRHWPRPVLSSTPVVLPMPPARPTKGRRPF